MAKSRMDLSAFIGKLLDEQDVSATEIAVGQVDADDNRIRRCELRHHSQNVPPFTRVRPKMASARLY